MELKMAATSLSKPSFPHSSSPCATLKPAISSPSSMRMSFLIGYGGLFSRYAQRSSLFYNRSQSCHNSRFQKLAMATGMDSFSFSDEEFSLTCDEMDEILHDTDFIGNAKLINLNPLYSLQPRVFPLVSSNIKFTAHNGLPLRIINKKQQLKEGFVGVRQTAYCSVKGAFALMVLMVRELHCLTLQLKNSLHCDDLRETLEKVQMEIHTSFVWLFQKVFSQTPTLMIYAMLLLANYNIHGMSTSASINAYLHRQTYGSVLEEKLKWMSNEEALYWRWAVEKAHENSDIETRHSKTQKKQYDTPMPQIAFCLSKYAQFLWLICKDFDRVESCYKTAIEIEPENAEILCNYAQFLWQVRGDFWAAEETYQAAFSAEPDNTNHWASYAYFQWKCIPADSPMSLAGV